MTPIKRTRLLLTSLILLFLIGGTITAVFFAKGYRPSWGKKGTTLVGTGLLAASSYPEQSSVVIDGKLTTTTNDTLNLLPGKYAIEINKEGFMPWKKDLSIEKELVTTTNARLFPSAPSLSAITFSGATMPTPSLDGQRLAFFVTKATQSSNNGLYILSAVSNPLGLDRKPTQIANLPTDHDLAKAQLLWSPDGKQILLAFVNNNTIADSYLLNTDGFNRFPGLTDVTIRLPFIFGDWQQELLKIQDATLSKFPEEMATLLSDSSINVFFSPDGEKVLYTTTSDITLKDHLIPSVNSINSTSQTRNLTAYSTYVYDRKEDTNYFIKTSTPPTSPTPTSTKTKSLPQPTITNKLLLSSNTSTESATVSANQPPLTTLNSLISYYNPLATQNPVWYSTSRHLISTGDNKLTIFEYDNTNSNTVFSGSFYAGFTLPSTSGNRLFLLTNLNQENTPTNIYTLDLK